MLTKAYSGHMDRVLEDLAAEHLALKDLLDGLSDDQLGSPTRCEGWDVTDVLIHLAQSDEMAVGSAQGRFGEVLAELTEGLQGGSSIDEGVAAMVARERGAASAEIVDRWWSTANRLVEVLNDTDLSKRVMWVTGELSARTMATTRLAETWIHSGDIASAVGITMEPTDRLRQIARLAWRTLPYAFTSTGHTMTGSVAFLLTSPTGQSWDLLPDESALTTIRGSASDLCDVASRRVPASATALVGEGPDAEQVLALVRTYA
jgi:uncharacterized protein (TIGR03084 family)